MTLSPTDAAKRNAALRALEFVRPGMTIGLGTGSTAAHFVVALGVEVQAGLAVRAVATSIATYNQAASLGIPLLDPNDIDTLDLAVDGADEVDRQHHLIKGGGGALLREKIIAAAAHEFVVIVDAAKMKPQLGSFPLPVEVTPFGAALTTKAVQAVLRGQNLKADTVRMRLAPDGAPFISDGGNYILDCACGLIAAPDAVAGALSAVPGVVEHGLFIAMADIVIVGDETGAAVARVD
jgi:ribose 5-phosphate isomerase A